MRVVVTTESRFEMGPDGIPRCSSGTFDYRFWQRYLDTFERVTVVARCQQTRTISGSPVSGRGVTVWPLLNSHGAWGAVQNWRHWQATLAPLLREHSAWILRVPGQIGGALAGPLKRRGIPFAVEVVGDPATAFGRESFRHPLRPCIQWFFSRMLRSACSEAIAASYVTREFLQRHYPPNRRAFTTDYSSVALPPESFAARARSYSDRLVAPKIVSVATMSQRYKGQHHLIEAVYRCQQAGRRVELTLVGDGQYRHDLERQVARRQLGSQVRFAGQLSAGDQVRQELDRADLFVLASVGAEGLPRAIIEAQARGVPCIGTRLSGIPELLRDQELVTPGNDKELAQTILDLADDPDRLRACSVHNLQTAHHYRASELSRRRSEFYEFIKRRSQRPGSVRRRAA